MQPLGIDGFWERLFGPMGSPWNAPHDEGTLPFDVVMLVHPQRWAVTWWNDAANRYVGVDVCLPPVRTDDGWSYVDLELDVIRHSSGVVEIEDEDEFEAACTVGWIASPDAEVALATATAMADRLRAHEEPWGDEGWQRLDAARSHSA